MSYFSRFLKLISMMIMIMSLCGRLMAAEDDGENNSHIYQLSSREEMAKLAGYGEEKLSNVIITGSLLCQSCFRGERQIQTWPLSGALVTINCKGKRTRKNLVKAVTDEFGDFQIDLPSHLHGIPNLHKKCSVHAHRIPKSSACHPTFATNQKMLTLMSAKNGNRIYTTGRIKFLHSHSLPIHICTNGGSNYKIKNEAQF
ncbi:Pollen Ole e 1 allergen and extensin family protein [Euphorbia peplus]|nr:Pollen Ole e 1 allergen and extensin family protein [Euphorbia peplus]